MEINNQKKRIRLGYQNFLLSLLWTIFLFVLYILGKNFIISPEHNLISRLSQRLFNENPKERKFFSDVISSHLEANLFLGIISIFNSFFNFFKRDGGVDYNENNQKFVNFKNQVSKFLKPNLFAFHILRSNKNLIGDFANNYRIIFFIYLAAFASSCCFDIIINQLDKNGVCRGFDLIFLQDRISLIAFSYDSVWNSLRRAIVERKFSFLFLNIKDFYSSIFLLLFAIAFLFFSNMIWERSIEISSLYHNRNRIIYRPKFTFRAKFNFISLIYFSWFIEYIKFFIEFFNFYRNDNIFASQSWIFSFFSRIWKIFIKINRLPRPFSYVLLRSKYYCLALIIWIILSYSINWIYVYNFQFNSQKISNNLLRGGVYFDGVMPGEKTESLISGVRDRFFIRWSIFMIVANIIFDNIIGNESFTRNLSFVNWFTVVNIVSEIFEQVKGKYEKAKFYD